MARCNLEISRTAEKQRRTLPAEAQHRLARAMLALGSDPFSLGSRGLAGHDNVFRIRVGVYRVLYSVTNEQLVVIILKVGHRKDIFR